MPKEKKWAQTEDPQNIQGVENRREKSLLMLLLFQHVNSEDTKNQNE